MNVCTFRKVAVSGEMSLAYLYLVCSVHYSSSVQLDKTVGFQILKSGGTVAEDIGTTELLGDMQAQIVSDRPASR